MLSQAGCASRSVAARSSVPVLRRRFHSSPIASETVGEKVRELGHKVNIRVGQGLASAIDTGEKVTHATKERLEASAEEGKDNVEKKADDAAKGVQRAKKDLKKELKK